MRKFVTATGPGAAFDDAIELDVLRKRTSEKWAKYSAAVLPVFIAETDFPVPPAVARVLHAAIDNGDLGYAEPRELGKAYAAFAADRYACPTDPADVFALPDVMVGVAEILRSVTEAGDGVVINPPVYPPFFTAIREIGRAVVEVPLDTRHPLAQLDFEHLERAFAAGARAYVFCNPHNPVGRAFSFEDVARVAALAETVRRRRSGRRNTWAARPSRSEARRIRILGEQHRGAFDHLDVRVKRLERRRA